MRRGASRYPMSVFDGRKDERFTFDQDIIINDSILTKCLDISLGGMNILINEQLELGSVVSILIPDYGMTVHAEVRYCAPGEGAGLKFVIETKDEWENVVTLIENLSADASGDAIKPTVLIVDDSDTFRAAMKKFLHKRGYSVAEAADGLEAIKKMNMYPFNAVLVDLHMAKIDGVKLVSLIREAPDHKDKPVIVFSAKADRPTVEKALKAGANKFIPKTKTMPGETLKALHHYLKKMKANGSPASEEGKA